MVQTQDGNVFVDLSGPSTSTSGNPYDNIIEAAGNDPQQIQKRYSSHRDARNEQQKAKLLSPDFTGFIIDPILDALLKKETNPGYVDPRNCLVFWGRPPKRIRDLVAIVQQRLLETDPGLWLMPPDNLHLTIVEMAHSKTPEEIAKMRAMMRSKIPEICEHACKQPARLVKPLLGYDAAAIALSFLPAAGEDLPPWVEHDDGYTYHHLRRDIHELCESTGVEIASRYVLPSAHLTVARFVNQDLYQQKKIPALIETLEKINEDLRGEFWGNGRGAESVTAQWLVGEERTVDCRVGTVWYGGGESEYASKGTKSLCEDEYKFP